MNEKIIARAATLKDMRENLLPQFLSPVPSDETLREWFKRAGIPALKANPLAKRGGGKVFYSTSAVEKLMRNSFVPAGARN